MPSLLRLPTLPLSPFSLHSPPALPLGISTHAAYVHLYMYINIIHIHRYTYVYILHTRMYVLLMCVYIYRIHITVL